MDEPGAGRTAVVSIPDTHTGILATVSVPDTHTGIPATVSVPDTHTGIPGSISSTSEYNPFNFPQLLGQPVSTPYQPVPAPFQPVTVPSQISLPPYWVNHPLAMVHSPLSSVASSKATGGDDGSEHTSSVGLTRNPSKPPTTATPKQNATPPTSGSNIQPPSSILLMRGVSQDPSRAHNKKGNKVDTPYTPMSIGVRETEWVQLAQLGLGKALDATNPHPWASKSSYQAKEVLYQSDLVLTDEGQRLVNYVKVIDNYFNVLGSLEGAIRLPHQPIEIGVAADTHRSYCLTQEIRGKTVYTRTIAFNITAHTYSNSSSSDDDDDTPFQRHLKLHLERAYEGTGREERNPASDVSLCLEFLHTLGGVTHYVSSITLGAMEYSVKKVQALDIGSTINSRAGFGPMAGAFAAKAIVRKSRCKQVQHSEKIGRISESDVVRPHTHYEAVINYSITSLANLVTDPPLRECVQKAIQSYITTRLHKKNGPYYIMTPERVEGDRNIFWRVEEERGRGGVVTHYIRLTTSLQHASTFFIRPDYRKMGRYFFITTYDTNGSTATEDQQQPQCSEQAAPQEPATVLGDETDGGVLSSSVSPPEDTNEFPRIVTSRGGYTNGPTATDDQQQPQCSEQPAPHEPATVLEDETDGGVLSSSVSPPEDTNEFPRVVTSRGGFYGHRRRGDGGTGTMHHRGDSTKGISSNVERYVHVSRITIFKHLPTSVRIKIKAKAAVRPQFARFQLVDRRDRREKTILESDWLPDERELPGQPFFLRPHYQVTNCLGASWIGGGARVAGRGEEGRGHFSLSGMSCHCEGNCHMLFQLVRAESSDMND